MDLKIETDEFRVKIRTNGIILNNNKVLMCCINHSDFWCCPGGHIHLGEDSKTAALREIKEEVGISFDDAKLITMMESFFKDGKGKLFHELSFYYLMQGRIPVEKCNDYSYDENDEGKMVRLEFKWFDLDRLKNIDIRPANLKETLKNRDFNLQHVIRVEY